MKSLSIFQMSAFSKAIFKFQMSFTNLVLVAVVVGCLGLGLVLALRSNHMFGHSNVA